MKDDEMNTTRTKSTGVATPRKRHHFTRVIILVALGVIGVIVYLLHPALIKRYEGLGFALCAVAWGIFMIWHVIHLFAEEDEIEEQQIDVNQTTVSPPESNPAPPKPGQNIK
jgi:hypothetical protein